MNRRLPPVRIHPVCWLIIGTAVLTGHFRELLLFSLIIFLHECGHTAAAFSFGWTIRRIVLFPFGGAAEFDQGPNRPFQEEVTVILAGPAMHLLLAAAAFLLVQTPVLSIDTYNTLFQMNTALLLLNIVPVLPLDGGRLLQVLSAQVFSFQTAQQAAAAVSWVVFSGILAVLIAGEAGHLQWWVLAAFLFMHHYQFYKSRPYVYMRFLLERQQSFKHLEKRTPRICKLPPETPVKTALSQLRLHQRTVFIVQPDGEVLHEKKLLEESFRSSRWQDRLEDVIGNESEVKNGWN
ncbi:sporulation factor SpoIVFB [Salsuginibacillus halophilus]|uniref:Sporulation factor SpoIVFB n=1 Tax=Salsuginibacillus halophilus TaxID=517424 RepID=A0A2P8HCV9_9BACI|nr:site-2 protease family protein [Salsuginibacillus halophilus]PSL43961.1 sporulation factor SpoIVFB [Salsuginibacillus halophilus]